MSVVCCWASKRRGTPEGPSPKTRRWSALPRGSPDDTRFTSRICCFGAAPGSERQVRSAVAPMPYSLLALPTSLNAMYELPLPPELR